MKTLNIMYIIFPNSVPLFSNFLCRAMRASSVALLGLRLLWTYHLEFALCGQYGAQLWQWVRGASLPTLSAHPPLSNHRYSHPVNKSQCSLRRLPVGELIWVDRPYPENTLTTIGWDFHSSWKRLSLTSKSHCLFWPQGWVSSLMSSIAMSPRYPLPTDDSKIIWNNKDEWFLFYPRSEITQIRYISNIYRSFFNRYTWSK